MDIPAFRAQFPQFADATVYTDAQVGYWGTFGAQVISTDSWGTSYNNGVSLYVAHQLVLNGGIGVAGISRERACFV